MDGTTKTLSLSATATFQDVLTQLGSPSAKLMTTFPKRIFTSADVGSTLKELGMNWWLRKPEMRSCITQLFD